MDVLDRKVLPLNIMFVLHYIYVHMQLYTCKVITCIWKVCRYIFVTCLLILYFFSCLQYTFHTCYRFIETVLVHCDKRCGTKTIYLTCALLNVYNGMVQFWTWKGPMSVSETSGCQCHMFICSRTQTIFNFMYFAASFVQYLKQNLFSKFCIDLLRVYMCFSC